MSQVSLREDMQKTSGKDRDWMKDNRIQVESNNVRKIREGLLMSKAELARRAGVSVLTIDRVEKGMTCRMDTKRKIILSLGLQLSDRDKVFTKGN